MRYPEKFYPSAESHNTPATLSGLNAMPGNSEVLIDAIGIAKPEAFFADSVSIVVGFARGRDATGNSYPYTYDTDIEVTRIADVHGAPMFATASSHARYVAVGWGSDPESGERTRTAVPLVPGMHHLLTDQNDTVLGWYEVTEAGGLHVVRVNEQAPWTDVRVVGVHNSIDDYSLQPPLVAPAPIQDVMLEVVEGTARIDRDTLVLDPGLHVPAEDALTGQIVDYTLQHALRIPNGQPGRFETLTANVLRQRQQFVDAIRVRPAAPDA